MLWQKSCCLCGKSGQPFTGNFRKYLFLVFSISPHFLQNRSCHRTVAALPVKGEYENEMFSKMSKGSSFYSGILGLSLPVGCFLAAPGVNEATFTEKHVSQLAGSWISTMHAICCQMASPCLSGSRTGHFTDQFLLSALILVVFLKKNSSMYLALDSCNFFCWTLDHLITERDWAGVPVPILVHIQSDRSWKATNRRKTNGEKNMDTDTPPSFHTSPFLRSSSRGNILLSALATIHPGLEKWKI